MRGSTGVSTGVRTTPSRMKKHKTVDYLRITGWKSTKLPMSDHHRTAIARRHLYDVSLAGRWLPVLVTFCVRSSLLSSLFLSLETPNNVQPVA